MELHSLTNYKSVTDGKLIQLIQGLIFNVKLIAAQNFHVCINGSGCSLIILIYHNSKVAYDIHISTYFDKYINSICLSVFPELFAHLGP